MGFAAVEGEGRGSSDGPRLLCIAYQASCAGVGQLHNTAARMLLTTMQLRGGLQQLL